MKKVLVIIITIFLLSAPTLASAVPFAIGTEIYEDENGETVVSYGTFPHMDGSSFLYPLAEILATQIAGTADAISFRDKDMAMTCFAEKLDYGYECAIDMEKEIYLEISRPNLLLIANYTPEDEIYLESGGDQVESEVIARDALVLVCSEVNPVSNLTCDEARDIITGDVLYWSEVGGEDLPINTYYGLIYTQDLYTVIRDKLETDGALAEPMTEEQYIPNGVEDGPGYTISYYTSFENTPECFTISTYHEAKNMREVKLLSIEGTAPTEESIKSGEYMLTFDCAAVYNKAEPVAESFAKWLAAGGEASEIIKKAGFIPIKEAISLDEDSPECSTQSANPG